MPDRRMTVTTGPGRLVIEFDPMCPDELYGKLEPMIALMADLSRDTQNSVILSWPDDRVWDGRESVTMHASHVVT